MKNPLAALEPLTLFVFLTIALPAAGTGGPGTQGPRFLGAGLDEPQIVSGVYAPGPIQEFVLNAGQFPPASPSPTPKTTSGPPIFEINHLRCSADGTMVANCTALIKTSIQPSSVPFVCTGANPSGDRPVKLIALKAKWDPTTAALDFTASDTVVFACKDPSPGKPDPMDKIGAFGKCVGVGFKPTTSGTSEFQACVRANRADYCGNGLSLTLQGTPLTIYDHPPPSSFVLCKPGTCFEASWDESGARCINHARYEHLLLLSTIQTKRPYEKKSSKEKTGSQQTGSPGPANPRVEGMEVCGPQYDPIGQCVAQYTDFYYDDTHPIGTGVNPIDAVTSQFVCRTGKVRKFPQAVLTRTKVRFVVSSTQVDTLSCCDSLGCP